MTEYKEGIDYTLIIPEEQNQNIDVKILKGDFTGVIYSYGRVAVEEKEEDDGSAHLNFEYDIFDSNGMENLEENEKFKNFIGDILVSMIMSQIPKGE